MITRRHARELRRAIERGSASMPDEDALDVPELFPLWAEDVPYAVNDRVRYDGTLYKCLQAHTSQTDWTPDVSVSLWARVLIPEPEVIPEWVQPDSTNPYMAGDKVKHNGHTWESAIDGNVWEPGVYGWNQLD